MDEQWNHNVHYHPLVLGFVPDGCGRALDVGCGDGTLIRKLAARARHVTGVDRSPEMIAAARAHCGDLPHARFAETGFPGTHPELFAPGSGTPASPGARCAGRPAASCPAAASAAACSGYSLLWQKP
ncbi:class I SAM-dependent methyltransferase [Actinomadura rayongensis]|uniref:Methyltransferase domain-containing protein n=1 Tax=Actinomadura rayongensis TaxID=1429076 RepID=A0A6I4W3Y7_9ACTN|nr:class I SAM-dependent methyltransferase [Actinomadura rayongensis]MXQ64138.1 methyltransferase domain-containing protein [Actinomadura rayongensis]